jgi:hypothetical protein
LKEEEMISILLVERRGNDWYLDENLALIVLISQARMINLTQ